MKVNDFDYVLPKRLIAQTPLEKRDTSKLMVLNRNDDSIKHQNFYDITNYFGTNDVIVLNDSKVLPARLYGNKIKTNAKIEILLLKEIEPDIWEILVKPARRVKPQTIINFSNKLQLEILEVKDKGIAIGKLIYDGVLIEILSLLGEMPLPPYIHEKLKDSNHYQTIYAKNLGSAAAPTAGFHFTNETLQKLKSQGVEIINVTLHVGLGTFRPVDVTNVEDHDMHYESYYLSDESASLLNQAIKNHKKITCVGTTSLRVLESNYTDKFNGGYFETNLFIYPGYKFKVVDHLITNFHLPKSTLLMLVSAFYSREKILAAYNDAILHNYRFFSFGDSMLIY
ncbi:MAG: tRNA preQ1(34) S-adenosylmethionine ribosyltransferase-isomerase QueA [Acholeplasmataceae bacterium]|jgi:S-adenosylmethionine:tRNA ribosyltransferase-isomerase